MSSIPDTHQDFIFLRQETIQSLQLNAQLFQHRETGAQHIHLDTGQDENVFLVAFRTMPMDSTGVCLLYTSPSPRDVEESRMPSSA